MIYKVEDISRDVRVALDENKVSEQLIADEDIDTLSLDEIVRSKIEEGAERVFAEAPLSFLDCGRVFGDAVYWRDLNCGWILLPDDFMRLVIFKMSDWERPVWEAVMVTDPRYELQFSRYQGIRGNPQKPVVAIVRRMEGLALEFFSCRDQSATVEQAKYISVPKIDSDGGINIPERCYKAVVYKVASMTSYSLGQGDQGTLLDELSKRLLL
ncbi:MAG: hypothetical protein K2M41_02205 [Muribaculaceae bacterium]|nr:hypothetical protein [Muribaculaceae bacterium]